MAEVAAGAVTSLLDVIRSEARLLHLVQSDVQFIKEEMESMNSFLAHLARSAPPGREHDEQVLTWMNQVRLLAQDCNNCIGQYRVGGGLRRHLWWVPRFLHKLVAQHRAAVQLRELRDRARDVSERRIRYGVEVPSKPSAGQQLPPAARLTPLASSLAVAGGYAAEDDEEDDDGDDHQLGIGATTDHSAQRALFSRTLDDYVKMKLLEWTNNGLSFLANGGETMSIAIMASDRDLDTLSVVNETLVLHPGCDSYNGYNRAVLIDIPACHPDFSLPLRPRPKEVLYYILHQLKHEQLQPQSEEGLDSSHAYSRQLHIYGEKKRALNKIKKNIKWMKICEKVDKIKSDILTSRPPKGQQKKAMHQHDPDVHEILRMLFTRCQQDQSKNEDMAKLSPSDETITQVAKKLKKLMEEDEQGGGGEGSEQGVGRGVENEAVQEEDCEGAGKETVEEKRGGREIVYGDGGEGDIVECGGRGEILEEKHGGQGEILEEEHRGEELQIAPIYLHEDQYVHILRQVFPNTITSNKSSSEQTTDTILGEDQIKHDKMQETLQNTEDIFEEIVDQKMDKIKHEFKEQLKIKGLVDDIKDQIRHICPLFILKISEKVDLPRWEDTRKALSLLACCADVLIITTAKDIQQAKEYCYPQCEPIDYSLVGLYYDTVLEITKQQKYEKNYNPQIFRNILEQCQPHEFCMKMFAHALYINPKRSNEELNKLHRILKASTKSFKVIAKKMFKFSYTDMPKEYQSCLLYLAIFTPGYKIRRSTLIGQWVAEGLISKEDWTSSVHWANRCFDELIGRCLADPADTGVAGKVKSCVVGDLIHGFISEIARKQNMVETRLPHHLDPQFSIFNALQLRSSEKIDGFFQRLSKSSQVSLLTVLDLEGCQCFGRKNQRYLKDICSKMLLLKYLSLRRTNATQLPSKINNLHELEVLDIRQTNVPTNATANVLLLKLKRLLAGNTDRTPRPTLRAEESVSTAVQIPHKIEQMVNMEVLSNVKARSSRDLKDIGKLWQLRKLGVVVNNNSRFLKNLLRAISDLHECLCSLSITLLTATIQELPEVSLILKHQPRLLESLSISGTTQKEFLPLFIKDANNLVKVTLSSTSLNQNNLKDLARLPKLQLIRLHHIEFTNSKRELIFKQDEFISLKYLLVEGSTFTKVSFRNGAASMLEKMVLSFTNMVSVSGVEGLQKLEEVELIMSMSSSNKKNNETLISSFNNGKKMAKLALVGTHEQGDQQIHSMIKFNIGEFQKLRLLTVDCSATKVVFTNGSAPKLEKIIWSSSTSLFLYGIDNLPRLKEVEFNGDLVPKVVEESIKNHKNKPDLKRNKPEIQDQAKADEQEDDDDDDDAARFPLFCWKKQV